MAYSERQIADAKRRSASILLDHLPKDRIISCYLTAGGGELLSSKLASPASSAALAANAFGYFLSEPGRLTLPVTGFEAGSALSVTLEAELRFPWTGGKHAWVDVAVETARELIGIESKRYEPYRDPHSSAFSSAYDRPVWGERMKAFELMRDSLQNGVRNFQHLDAAQLVKHAFALRT